jgi:hypothetical protein
MRDSPLQRRKVRSRAVPKLPLFDEVLINAALELADGAVTSADDVRRALTPLLETIVSRDRNKIRGPEFTITLLHWKTALRWIRRLLPRVRGYGSASPAEKQDVRAAVNAELRLWLFDTPFQAGPDGMELDLVNGLWSVWLICSLAMFAFVVPEGLNPNRLGQCRYRNCGKWFLRPPAKRGCVAEYCPGTSHGSSERVLRMRSKPGTAEKSK